MAYGVKYRCQHKNRDAGPERTHTVELLKKDYSGSPTDVYADGDSGVGTLTYENLDPKNLLEKPVQKSRFEFFLLVNAAGKLDYDGMAIMDELFQSQEDEFQLRYLVDGNEVWQGWVLSDLMRYPENAYFYAGKIVAKDLTRLSARDYAIKGTGRLTLIEAIADILRELDLALPIHTHTGWGEAHIDNSSDFLHQIISKTQRILEDNEDANYMDALEKICGNFGGILRQMNGAWKLYQISALRDPSAVRQTVYNEYGVFQSTSEVDLRYNIENDQNFILGGSENNVNRALRSVKTSYDAGIDVRKVQVPESINLPDNGTVNYKQIGYVPYAKNPASPQKIQISLTYSVIAVDPDNTYNAFIPEFQFTDGTYWLRGSRYDWDNDVATVDNVGPLVQSPDGTYEKVYTRTADLKPEANGSKGFYFKLLNVKNERTDAYPLKVTITDISVKIYDEGTSPSGADNLVPAGKQTIVFNQASNDKQVHFEPRYFINSGADNRFFFSMEFTPHADNLNSDYQDPPDLPFYVRLRIDNPAGGYYYLTQQGNLAESSWYASADPDLSFPALSSDAFTDDNFGGLVASNVDGFVLKQGFRVPFREYKGSDRGTEDSLSFGFRSAGLPSNIDDIGQIQLSLYLPAYRDRTDAWQIDYCRFKSISLRFYNVNEENTSSSELIYKLTQDRLYSNTLDYGTVIFGDGPNATANSSLLYGGTDREITFGSWGFRFDSAYDKNIIHLLAEEIMNAQRLKTFNYNYKVLDWYDPEKIMQYRGEDLFFLGGTYTLYSNTFANYYLQLHFTEDPGTDRFEEIPPTASPGSPSGGSGGPGQIPPASGGGLDIAEADQRYFQIDNALSEGLPSQMRDTLDVFSKTESDGRYIQPSDDVVLTGNVDFAQQYTDLGTDFAGANIGIRVPRLESSDAYAYFNAARGRWGAKFGSAGGFDPWILESDIFPGQDYQQLGTGDSPTFQELLITEGVTLDELASYISSDFFAGGFGGSGTQLGKDAGGDWTLTVDNLVVRKLARYYELVIEKIRANGGTVFISPGAEKVEEAQQVGNGSWSWSDGVNVFSGATDPQGRYYSFLDQYTCYIEEDKLITIDEDDLLRRQQYNGRGTGLTEGGVMQVQTGAADPADNSPRRSFTLWITPASQPPRAGHEFAVMGNRTNPDRQNGIILTASDQGNPYRRIYAGVDSLEKFGTQPTIKGQDGRLDNLSVPYFDDLDGTQQNLFGAYWDGNFYVNDGHFRGVVEVTGGNAATKAYVDEQTGSSVTTIIADSAPATRDSGAPLQVADTWLDSNDGFRPYSWSGTQWIREYSRIDGGDIITGVVSANRLQIGSGSTFSTGYDPSTKETPAGAQAKVNSLQGDLDSIFDDAVAHGTTIITNGLIETDFIDVDALLAKNATITGILSLGTDGEIVRQSTINSELYVARFGDRGFDFRGGSAGGINAFEWHDGDLDSTSNLTGEVYSYNDTIDNRNNLVLRSQANLRPSDIYLTATRTLFRSDAQFDFGALFNGLISGNTQDYPIYDVNTIALINNINAPCVYVQHANGAVDIKYLDIDEDAFVLIWNDSDTYNLFFRDTTEVSGTANLRIFGSPYKLAPNQGTLFHKHNGLCRPHGDQGS